MKITADTKLQHFQFIENVEPDKIYTVVSNHFGDENPYNYPNPFHYVKFQIERAPDTGRRHVQDFAVLKKQARVANYPEKAIIYVSKNFNRCAIHKDKCKCSYQELELDECSVCTQECCSQRTPARFDEENSGPFEFGRYHSSYRQNNQNNSDLNRK
ncbi:6042_t:CDS:2 [Paraglomus occultum]|uniref:6042_t:CDS:1 n=1 Tax=Paraglomus occultum TaxID=144539 RepID=A0A9N9AM37_9GLOM|nr:6042_t:CDS:2 [Paraglomus occultum]